MLKTEASQYSQTDQMPGISSLEAGELNRDAVVAGRTLGRNAVLRALLDEPMITPETPANPGNYEFAQDSGLLDSYYFNPDTGEDAIVHILAGDMTIDPDTGAKRVEGFHHEASALHPKTKIDDARMEGKSGRREYRKFPFEQYQTEVVIHDYEKQGHSTMFPAEYDALTVLQTVKNARDNRDRANDQVAENGNIITTGKAPMIDGTAEMDLRLILQKDTEKIITAMPRAKKKHLMKTMTSQDVRTHLGLDD